MNISEAFALHDSRALAGKTIKTRKNYRSSYRSLLRAVGDIPIELVGEETVIVWKQAMLEDGKTGTTQRGYIMDLRNVINYLRRKGMNLYDMSLIELPANDTPPRTWLKPEEVVRLVNAAKNPRDRAIIACTFISGCRISEILNLDREQIDTPVDSRGLQEIWVEGKRGKYRPVWFNETARKLLHAYLETRTDRFKPLFISGQNRRITVSRVEQIVHQCTRDAGLDKTVTPHVLRHSFATDLLNNKAPLYEVSKTMGHANIATTANIYGHFDTDQRKNTLSSKQSKLDLA